MKPPMSKSFYVFIPEKDEIFTSSPSRFHFKCLTLILAALWETTISKSIWLIVHWRDNLAMNSCKVHGQLYLASFF